MNILLIDDNEEITKMLSKYLNLIGHDCTVSNDGRNGLSMIESEEYDVVLLDLAMPDFSGIDIIRSLVDKKVISRHKIVVFTASHIPNSKTEEFIKKWTYGIIIKPIDPDELEKYLSSINTKKKSIIQV